ncbi:hypothetical protein D3C76_153920 [compost metagenome]
MPFTMNKTVMRPWLDKIAVLDFSLALPGEPFMNPAAIPSGKRVTNLPDTTCSP